MSQLFPEIADYLRGHFPEVADAFGFKKQAKTEPTISQGIEESITQGPPSEYQGPLNPATVFNPVEETRGYVGDFLNTFPPTKIAGDVLRTTEKYLGTPLENTSLAAGPLVGRLATAAEEVNPVFYSRLRELVANNPQKAWEAQQLKGFATGKAGAEELKALEGLSGKFTKEQALQHIEQNIPQLEERMLGGRPDVENYFRRIGFSPEEFNSLPGDAQARLWESYKKTTAQNTGTKFSQYTEPGGENYREILLKNPIKNEPIDFSKYKAEKDSFGDWQVTKDGRFIGNPVSAKNEEDAIIKSVQRQIKEKPQGFKSSHFPDDPNTLVHVRLNDRVTADGKPVTFLEEVQSDWHQKGRREGYVNANKSQQQEAYNKYVSEGMPEMEAMDRAQSEFGSGRIPDAPFKPTEKWTELGVRRSLRDAAENGSEYFSWTTGEQQAARYDLSKKVGSIDYKRNMDGTYRIGVSDFDQRSSLYDSDSATLKQIEDTLGKEIAEKIKNGEGKPGGGRMTLQGGDLKIGGEGMKSFYDKLVPSVIQKIGKKYGVKIENIKLNNGMEQPAIRITPEMRKEILKGQPLASNKKDYDNYA